MMPIQPGRGTAGVSPLSLDEDDFVHLKTKEIKRGQRVLGAAPASDDPFSDEIVLYWSSTLSASDFLRKCSHLTHAPGNLKGVEIIADSEFLNVESDDLPTQIQNRSIVRFNAGDWSATWLAGERGQLNEIQACFARLPNVMRSMVEQSIDGFQPSEVEQFIGEIQDAA